MLLVGADSQRQRCLEAIVPSCDLCLRADALPALVRHFLPRDARRALHALGKANPTCTLPTLRDPTYALAMRVRRVACAGSECVRSAWVLAWETYVAVVGDRGGREDVVWARHGAIG